ncbi:endothelin-converting enzyme 1-like isoform X2 [Leptopilina heterotoma]|uniref:endothelin-converting enzyme 1-like isoform X2 n=1 Tax=Leptopilina heterotoma TaxID=63436 RepID=UPI001CA7E707|nr:endothelin-converting enzyme 1-like isoform X2 [Leptopilina heterotoma]
MRRSDMFFLLFMLSALADVYSFDVSIDDIYILESSNAASHSHLLDEQRFYNACMDPDHSIEEGRSLYKIIVIESMLAGPLWQNVAAYYATKIGEISLFHVSLNHNNELEIMRPGYTKANLLPFEKLNLNAINIYLSNPPDRMWYNQYRESDANFQSQFIQFLRSINKLVYGRVASFLPVTIRELREIYITDCPLLNSVSEINWLHFFLKLSEGGKIPFTDFYEIKIDWIYLSNLCQILSVTPNNVIVRYLQFNFETSFETLFYVTPSLNDAALLERSHRCISTIPITDGFYELLADSDDFYRREEFLNTMIDMSKHELVNEIQNSWLDDVSKARAINVTKAIKLRISKMNFPYTRKEMDSTSYDFNVTPVGLLNWINYRKAQTAYKFELSLIHMQQQSLNERKKREIDLNAFYTSSRNIITLTTAFLFPPAFYMDAPIAYNFGRLGFIIGHEISHAFDYPNFQARHGYEIFNQEDLSEIFNRKMDCVANQFNDLDVDGRGTLKENVADTQGLKLAFKAMRRYIDLYPILADERLGNIYDFDANKLFFISFANRYCEVRNTLNVDAEHSPSDKRVIGTLQNMREFAETFQCEEGQFMNPVNKCDFWEDVDQ